MKKSPFFESHKSLGARFISFAGWQMPFAYQSPAQEHLQTRKTGGIFDVSHMGEIRVKGKDSLPFLERLLPADLPSLSTGQALYTVLCKPAGGLIDDLIVYALSRGEDYLLCVNSAQKNKDMEWIKSQIKGEKLELKDESQSWALIALQGPDSFALCEKIFPSVPFQKIPKFHFAQQDGNVYSQTGYTGEQGFEIYIPWEKSLPIWNRFLEEGGAFSIGPVGLGARDTLRLEMAYLLAGQDFDETKSPLQAGLAWLLKSKKDYIGRQALLKQKAQGGYPRLKGFVVKEPSGVPRKACPLYSGKGQIIGHVTSGAKSPSLGKMIGLAYIQGEEEVFYVDIRGQRAGACAVPTPFLHYTDRV